MANPNIQIKYTQVFKVLQLRITRVKLLPELTEKIFKAFDTSAALNGLLYRIVCAIT